MQSLSCVFASYGSSSLISVSAIEWFGMPISRGRIVSVKVVARHLSTITETPYY